MKLFKKIAVISVGAMMAIGLGAFVSQPSAKSASAASLTAATCDFTTMTSASSTYTASWTYNTDWNVFGGANNNAGWAYVKMGGKNTNLASANPVYINNITAISEAIEQVTVSTIAGSLSKTGMSVNSWGLYVYSDSALTTQIDYVAGGTITNSAADFDFVPTSGSSWAAGSYFKVSFDLANTTTTNGIIYIDTVSFLYSGTAVLPTSVSVSLDQNTIAAGSTTTATASVLPVDASDSSVTWSSSDETVAIVSSLGVVTGIDAGSANITATCNGDNSVTGYATVTVTNTVVAVDKGITALRLGYGGSYSDNYAVLNGIVYGRTQVMYSSSYDASLQLRNTTGKFFNATPYPTAIQTLIVSFSTTATYDPSGFTVYAGTSAGSTLTSMTGTSASRVYTYDFTGSTYNYFSITNTGSYTVYIASIEVQIAGTLATNTRAWATSFLSGLTCDSTGATVLPTAQWTTVSNSFLALSVDEQSAIAGGSYLTSELQSNVGSAIERAVERYDYVLAKYGTTNYANFMDRSVVSLSAATITGSFYTTSNTAVLMIVLVSFTALVATAGYFLLKKKKEVK